MPEGWVLNLKSVSHDKSQPSVFTGNVSSIFWNILELIQICRYHDTGIQKEDCFCVTNYPK